MVLTASLWLRARPRCPVSRLAWSLQRGPLLLRGTGAGRAFCVLQRSASLHTYDASPAVNHSKLQPALCVLQSRTTTRRASAGAMQSWLLPETNAGQDLLNNGVARVNNIVDKDVCRELRAEVEKWLAVEDAVPDDARFVPGTRLSLSTPMRLSFAGSRADLLLPIEEPVVSNVAATAIKACLAGVEKSRTCLLYTSPSPRDVEESRMPSSA